MATKNAADVANERTLFRLDGGVVGELIIHVLSKLYALNCGHSRETTQPFDHLQAGRRQGDLDHESWLPILFPGAKNFHDLGHVRSGPVKRVIP
jgi:hypothetical protein